MRTIQSVFGASIAAAVLTLTGVAAAQAAPKPKLSVHQAEAIAAHRFHGRAASAKYEFEDGHWQYAVIVDRGKQMWEVEVDPRTGRVLDSERTSAAEERQEAQADLKAAKAARHTHRTSGHHAK